MLPNVIPVNQYWFNMPPPPTKIPVDVPSLKTHTRTGSTIREGQTNKTKDPPHQQRGHNNNNNNSNWDRNGNSALLQKKHKARKWKMHRVGERRKKPAGEREREKGGERERESDWESENESERIRIALLQQLMHIKVSILPFCSALKKRQVWPTGGASGSKLQLAKGVIF